ncbi:MAG: glycosyl transferase family 1, partial [Pseudomonadota bacterium]
MSLPLRLDLSRLVWRARHPAPSGIDRVELAYARHFLGRADTQFVIRAGAVGGRMLDPLRLEGFLEWLEASWQAGGKGALSRTAALLATSRAMPGGAALGLIPSHQNWHRPAWLERLKGKGGKLV